MALLYINVFTSTLPALKEEIEYMTKFKILKQFDHLRFINMHRLRRLHNNYQELAVAVVWVVYVALPMKYLIHRKFENHPNFVKLQYFYMLYIRHASHILTYVLNREYLCKER